MFCPAAPPIPRPSNEEFLKNAKEGKKEQLVDSLLHYPDLVDVENTVGVYCGGRS